MHNERQPLTTRTAPSLAPKTTRLADANSDVLEAARLAARPIPTRRAVIGGALALAAALLAGCAGSPQDGGDASPSTSSSTTFTLGDTTFNAENEEPDINPHNAYSGWATIRYGVGETLWRSNDSFEMEPWLAKEATQPDDLTWQIVIRDGVTFSSGRALDAQAAKECLEDLVATHERAAKDLAIASIDADGQTLTIKTTEPKPALPNYLGDPYSCLIDMQAGITPDGMVVGTGPYVATGINAGSDLTLEANPSYWAGTPGYAAVHVIAITDGDTLTMSLQSGEIDAAYGMPYASYPVFSDTDAYAFTSCATSRCSFLTMNFDSPVCSDPAVRTAIAMAVDKQTFVDKGLEGNGVAASGPFPDGAAFGGAVTGAKDYDPDGARVTLEQAGWKDTDGDGIREKDGTKLTIRLLTYPSRQELPLLAESIQATLKDVGIDVQVNNTADHNTIRKDRSAWDVYAATMVMAPSGDPSYFFTARCLDDSPANNGHYHSDELEGLCKQILSEFDAAQREKLAVKMQEQLLADDAFVFCAHLKMSMIYKSGIEGLVAHPSDYYEVTADLKPSA